MGYSLWPTAVISLHTCAPRSLRLYTEQLYHASMYHMPHVSMRTNQSNASCRSMHHIAHASSSNPHAMCLHAPQWQQDHSKNGLPTNRLQTTRACTACNWPLSNGLKWTLSSQMDSNGRVPNGAAQMAVLKSRSPLKWPLSEHDRGDGIHVAVHRQNMIAVMGST